MPQNSPAEPTPNQPKLEGARRVNHRPVRKQTTVFPYRGKWRIQYLDHLGRNRTVTAQTKADAYTKLAEIEGHLSSGFQNPMSKEIPTFAQFAHYWLGQRQSSLSPITFLDYQATVNNWLNPYLGTFRLETINPTQIQGLYKHLAEKFQKSPGTIKKYHAVLLGIFSLAKRHGLLKFDPMELVKPPKLVKKPIQVFTPEEVTRILETAKTLDPKAHLRWSLALRYGLRQGESLGLKFSDINLRNQTITIQRTVNSLPNKGVTELPQKTATSRRTIPIDETITQLIEELTPGTSDEFIFKGANNQPIDATMDQRHWRNLLKAAEVRHLNLHSARHTVATTLIQQGINPRAVQLILGHSSPAYTLQTYVHPTTEDIRALLVPAIPSEQILTSMPR